MKNSMIPPPLCFIVETVFSLTWLLSFTSWEIFTFLHRQVTPFTAMELLCYLSGYGSPYLTLEFWWSRLSRQVFCGVIFFPFSNKRFNGVLEFLRSLVHPLNLNLYFPSTLSLTFCGGAPSSSLRCILCGAADIFIALCVPTVASRNNKLTRNEERCKIVQHQLLVFFGNVLLC